MNYGLALVLDLSVTLLCGYADHKNVSHPVISVQSYRYYEYH
jgi:hypothetical protein